MSVSSSSPSRITTARPLYNRYSAASTVSSTWYGSLATTMRCSTSVRSPRRRDSARSRRTTRNGTRWPSAVAILYASRAARVDLPAPGSPRTMVRWPGSVSRSRAGFQVSAGSAARTGGTYSRSQGTERLVPVCGSRSSARSSPTCCRNRAAAFWNPARSPTRRSSLTLRVARAARCAWAGAVAMTNACSEMSSNRKVSAHAIDTLSKITSVIPSRSSGSSPTACRRPSRSPWRMSARMVSAWLPSGRADPSSSCMVSCSKSGLPRYASSRITWSGDIDSMSWSATRPGTTVRVCSRSRS